jgi:hypothetical protein
MGVNTQGIMNSEVKLDQIVYVLKSKFNVTPKVEKTHDKDYHTVYFNYNNESRMLSVFENYTDKSHTNKDKVTLIDLNLWGSSIELIRGIVEEFGGEMVEADSNDNWFEVKKKDGTPYIKYLPIFNMFDRVNTDMGNGTVMEVSGRDVTVKIDGMFLPHTFDIGSVEKI